MGGLEPPPPAPPGYATERMLLKQEKVPLVQDYFFRIRTILESAILATRNLVLIS